MQAETAYLFRHALLRDAAYQLQLPGDRAKLHVLAFQILGLIYGPPPTDSQGPAANDFVMAEMAAHARQARALDQPLDPATESLCCARAAELAERNYQGTNALKFWMQHAEVSENHARSLGRAGFVALQFGLTQEAKSLLLQARDEAQNTGDLKTQAKILTQYAELLKRAGDTETALATYQLAQEAYEATGNSREALRINLNCADGLRELGRFDESERLFNETLTELQSQFAPGEYATALSNLAGVHKAAGRTQLAEQELGQALAIHRASGNRRFEGIVLSNLATIFMETNRLDQASGILEQALAIHREVGNRRLEGITLANWAALEHHKRNPRATEERCHSALAILREVGDRRTEATVVSLLAGLAFERGDLDEAERGYALALEMHRQTKNRSHTAALLASQALLLLARGRSAEARTQWREAVAELNRHGVETLHEMRVEEMRKACAAAGVHPFDD